MTKSMTAENFATAIRQRWEGKMTDATYKDIRHIVSNYTDAERGDLFEYYRINYHSTSVPQGGAIYKLIRELGLAERRNYGEYEYLYHPECNVYFYGCFNGSETRSEWNAYVKRCPICHESVGFQTVYTETPNEHAIKMKDHCYGSAAMECLDKSDLQGAGCSDWGRGKYGDYCSGCACRRCCGEEYKQRGKEKNNRRDCSAVSGV